MMFFLFKIFLKANNIMEVVDKCAALLCNKEVFTVLEEYTKQQKQSKHGDQNLNTITYETLKYLNETTASVQTPESIENVLKNLSSYGLTKAEKLQLINLRPTTAVELSLIIEESEERISEEQMEEILEILLELPALVNENEEDNNDLEETEAAE